MKLAIAAAALLCVGLSPLDAQVVGTLPEKSPYTDFTYRQDIAVFGGYFSGAAGEANIGPKSGPLIGVRYGLHVGGPAELSLRVARAFSTRNVLDPTLSGAARDLGTKSDPLWIVDAAINIALTGQKSYHSFVPLFGVGLGVASSSAPRDVGGYAFGTGLALHVGGGIRYVTHGPFGARLDLTEYLWQLSYPGAYYVAPAGGTAVLQSPQPQNQWTRNGVLTLGIYYIFAR